MAEVGLDRLCEGPGCGPLGVGPAGGRDGVAAVMIATAGGAECELCGF
jgi:hypothetical protein